MFHENRRPSPQRVRPPSRSCWTSTSSGRRRGQRWTKTRRSAPAASSRVERFDRRPIEPFELLHIRIPVKFCQNSGSFSQFFRNSENVETSQHFLECSAKFRKKSSNSARSSMQIVDFFCRNLNKTTNTKTFDDFFTNILNVERCEGV